VESPGLTAALAGNGNWAVHGLALDDDALARARQAIESRNLAGHALVEKVVLPPLPYLPNLANLIVVEDLGALAARGITREDVLQVLAPEGVLCVREGQAWQKTLKLRPGQMDSWPQTYHGADGNMVSTDQVFQFPIGYRWIDGLPHNALNWASCRGWIVSGRRCYTVSMNEPENVNKPERLREHYLSARDAFNGLPLWKINLKTHDDGAGLNWRNAASIAADQNRVYVPQANQVIAADADTGRIALTFPTMYPPRRLVLLGNILIVTSWEEKDVTKLDYEGGSLWATWVPKGGAGSVEAFDTGTGKLLWSAPAAALQLLAADGVAYVLAQDSNPPTARQVIALDVNTGKQRWRATHTTFGQAPDLQLNCAGSGFVVVAKRKERAVLVLSATDGKLLWQIKPAGGIWTPLVDSVLWNGNKKYDPLTGTVKGTLPTGIPDQGCTPSVIVGPYITQSRGCNYVELPASPGGQVKRLRYTGARGACMEGMVPANGLFYTAQNWCGCAPGQIYGFLALGPCGEVPTAEEFAKTRPTEKGPAFGSAGQAAVSDAEDWPAFRHDAQRSGASPAKIPEGLKLLWQSPVLLPAGAGTVAAAWKARLVSPLTSPVSTGGQVVVGGTDAGQVFALDTDSGRKLWTASLGGRLDTPPTFHRGLWLAGSHDGWVYALRAKDGQLAWRTRVAPRERRLVAHGEVESVWPVIGTVLVHDNVAYANAGRSSESDGGIRVVALDPLTGATLWAKEIGPGPQRMNDLLCLRDGALAWHNLRLDLKTGQAGKPDPVATSQGGIIDGTWTLLGTRRSGNAFTIGQPDAKKQQTKTNLLVWNDGLVLAPNFAMTRSRADTTVGVVKGQDQAWRPVLPANSQVEALVLCGNAVLYAGRFRSLKQELKAGEPAGFLLVTSTEGKKLAEFPLEAPPTYDGLAVARDRVYVSLQNGTVLCFGKLRG
jgi:outer membrane protein assembly factor BamB